MHYVNNKSVFSLRPTTVKVQKKLLGGGGCSLRKKGDKHPPKATCLINNAYVASVY